MAAFNPGYDQNFLSTKRYVKDESGRIYMAAVNPASGRYEEVVTVAPDKEWSIAPGPDYGMGANAYFKSEAPQGAIPWQVQNESWTDRILGDYVVPGALAAIAGGMGAEMLGGAAAGSGAAATDASTGLYAGESAAAGSGTYGTVGGGTTGAGTSAAAGATVGEGLTGATAGDLAGGALKGAAISGGKTALQGGNLNDVLKSAGTGAISGGTGAMAGGGLFGAGVSAATNQALSNNGSGDQVAATGTQDTGLSTLYNNPNNLTTGQNMFDDNPYGDWGSGEVEGMGSGSTDPNDPGQYGYGGTDPQGNYPGTMPDDSGLPDWLKQGQEMYKNLSPFLRQLMGLPSSGDPNKPDPYRFPYGNIVTAGLGVGGEMARQSSLQNTMGQVMNADKWNQEATRYWSPLYDAATKGIGNTAYGQSLADASSRKMSSMGYNMSGNQMNDVAQSLNAGTTQYMGAVAPLAMGRAPDTRAMAPLGLGMAESKGNLFNALNYGAQSVLRGDQSTGIGQPRQTLPQIFGF